MRLLLQKLLFIIMLGLSLQGCDYLKNLDITKSLGGEKYDEWEADKFHTKAQKAINKSNYLKAIKLYKILGSRYPFANRADQAQLGLAYSYYKSGEYDEAIATVNRFIQIHPRHPNIDYAYYLKGLVNYTRDTNIVERFLPIDTSQRDLSHARESYNIFSDLVTRFPSSKYTPNTKQRMIALKNNLAMHEIHIARFYLKREAYIAAANRAATVIEDYQHTPAIPYALLIMQEAYAKLGALDLGSDVERIYRQNYPDGPPLLEPNQGTLLYRAWNYIGLDK